ncbi:MAG: alkaline shock response membrane anchor protein AmaP [Bacillota bacterium]
MGAFDRGLVAVYSLLVSIAAIIAGAVYYGLLPANRLDILQPENKAAAAAGLLVLLLIGFRLIWASLSGPKRKKKERHVVVEDGSLGKVRIALSAVESLATKMVSQVPGMREVKAAVDGDAQGVTININATVTPDINIPEVSKDVQRLVQDKVKEVTGITVSNVLINVENISTNKPRVE